MIHAPPKETGRTALETPAAHSTAHNRHCTPDSKPTQRLPAYGRRLRAALDAGYRPRFGGGAVIVTTEWDFARSFDPGRVVCPSNVLAAGWDFRFLIGCDVVVLVPECDEILGEALVASIRDAGARLVVLAVAPEVEP